MNLDDFEDDEVQPATLEEWLARQRRELTLMRGAAHAQLDALFDQHDAQLVMEAVCIEREASGAALN